MMPDSCKRLVCFPFRSSVAKSDKTMPFDSLGAGSSASSSLVTLESQVDFRESKLISYGFSKSMRRVLPKRYRMTDRDSAAKQVVNDESDHNGINDEDDAPLLNYTKLYRQYVDPHDELLSYPVHEEKPAEPTNVIY
ncbi:hypothetical protein MPSEU_001085700 [Mayamaea pseudoterrestris]|nr:hypothetical protein MPSEU_001085700 [Mayamaea pseudoterrestris]